MKAWIVFLILGALLIIAVVLAIIYGNRKYTIDFPQVDVTPIPPPTN